MPGNVIDLGAFDPFQLEGFLARGIFASVAKIIAFMNHEKANDIL